MSPPSDKRGRREAIPIDFDDEPSTLPHELLTREALDDDEVELVKRSKRDSSDPITTADFARYVRWTERRRSKDRERTERREAEAMRELRALLERAPTAALASEVAKEVNKQLEPTRELISMNRQLIDAVRREISGLVDLEKDVITVKSEWQVAKAKTQIATWAIRVLVGLGASIAGYAGVELLKSAKAGGESLIRMQHMERAIERLEDREAVRPQWPRPQQPQLKDNEP
jgi:hypothetical protein